MQDFSDKGERGALSTPRNSVFVDIAPPTLAFETFSPGERIFTIANHETVHLATGDQPSEADRRYRELFGGKVVPTSEHPETLLYNYLTNPREHGAALVQ